MNLFNMETFKLHNEWSEALLKNFCRLYILRREPSAGLDISCIFTTALLTLLDWPNHEPYTNLQQVSL